MTVRVPKKFICRYCKVEVLSREDKRAVLGKEHAKWCRRHK